MMVTWGNMKVILLPVLCVYLVYLLPVGSGLLEDAYKCTRNVVRLEVYWKQIGGFPMFSGT